jgi:DNA-binding NtrC family response regulator
MRAKPTKVLVVEDDRSLVAALLEETDLDVIEMNTAEDALDFMRDHGDQVAMLFLDGSISGRYDGIDLARAVSVRWPNVRMVITLPDPAYRADEMPPATLMPKPWRALDVLVAADQASSRR